MFYPREVVVLTWKSIFSYLLSFTNLEARELGSTTTLISVVPFSVWWSQQIFGAMHISCVLKKTHTHIYKPDSGAVHI